MKNLTYIVALFFLGWTASASTAKSVLPSVNNYGEAFIFVEGGVEFAVYPNGEFDFYFDPRFATTSVVNISTPRLNISYNAGYNYDAFVQYDDYGAVIQIEHVPVFYDYYGRIIQAGDVIIRYNHAGSISRVGGLNVHYNRFNRPIRYTGFINHYNPIYVYRPWHQYYVRPHSHSRIVYYEPYRAFYQPIRYDYVQFNNYYQVNNYYYNKNNFYRPGQQAVAYNYGRRTTSQRELEPVVRSSQNVRRNNASQAVNNNTRSGMTGRRTANKEFSESSVRQASNMERHEAAVRAQRGRNNVSPAQTRNAEPAVNTRPGSAQQRVEARSSNRRTTTANRAEMPQQRQSAVSRSTNERSSSVRTQSDTNMRSRNTSSTQREARPSGRSGNSGRSSGGRG